MLQRRSWDAIPYLFVEAVKEEKHWGPCRDTPLAQRLTGGEMLRRRTGRGGGRSRGRYPADEAARRVKLHPAHRSGRTVGRVDGVSLMRLADSWHTAVFPWAGEMEMGRGAVR